MGRQCKVDDIQKKIVINLKQVLVTSKHILYNMQNKDPYYLWDKEGKFNTIIIKNFNKQYAHKHC